MAITAYALALAQNSFFGKSRKQSPMSISLVLLVSLTCGLLTLALCLFAMQICTSLDIIDVPDERKHHARPTPLMGGIVLQIAVIPMVVAIALFAMEPQWTQHMLIWAASVGAMTLVGLADDRHTLSARDRLLVSFLVFGSAAIIDPIFNVRVLSFRFPDLELGLGTGWLAVTFTTICCVGLVNAVNMADGKNGLVIGLCLGWLAFLGLRAEPAIAAILAILASSLVVLMIFNLRSKLFLGDGGAYGLATAIALASIATYNASGDFSGRAVTAEELMLLFLVPVLDSFRLTWSRVRSGRSPMTADRNHLHHHLQARFGWPLGLLVYLFVSLLPTFAWSIASHAIN